jgi:hypothetical protein
LKPFDHAFTADGKEYVLRYSFKARRVFEKRTGKSVPGIIKRLADPETQMADDVIEMFTVLLDSNNPNITADEVAKIIDDMGGEDAALTVLTKAISATEDPQ